MAILKDLIVNGVARVLGDTYAGKITATSFVKNGGTSSQFLKADGSVDNNTYVTNSGVTSITIKATSPISIDSSSAITSTGTRTLSHANSGVTQGSYGQSSDVNPSPYDPTPLSFKIPYITVSSSGHVTDAKNKQVTFPFPIVYTAISTNTNQLRNMKQAGELKPGQWYRITNYAPTFQYSGSPYTGIIRSGGHRFDILIQATTVTTLSPDAYACRSESDSDGYFRYNDLSKWKLKYALDDPYIEDATNSRMFDWADAETDGGIIYGMIDEWGNECPYDFKNIQMKLTGTVQAGYNGGTGTIPSYNPKAIADNNARYDQTGDWFYTFSYTLPDGEVVDYTRQIATVRQAVGTLFEQMSVRHNVIKPYWISGTATDSDFIITKPHQSLNWIVVEGKGGTTYVTEDRYIVHGNVFEDNCHHIYALQGNELISSFCNNHFGKDCHHIFCGTACSSEDAEWGIGVNNCTIGNNSYKILLKLCNNLTIGNNCNKILARSCVDHNSLSPFNTTIGPISSSIGNLCSGITIGGTFDTEEEPTGCNIGNLCGNIFVGAGNLCNYIGNDCNYIYIERGCVNNYIGNSCCYIGLVESSSSNTFEHDSGYIACNRYQKERFDLYDAAGISNAKMKECTFKSGSKYINLQPNGNMSTSECIRRMHVFPSASGVNKNSPQNIVCTKKNGNDSSSYHAIDEYIARTTTTGTPVIQSPML